MSQKIVQLIIGRVLTEHALRRRFIRQPELTLTQLREQGYALTDEESHALLRTDVRVWSWTAEQIHPQLQQADLATE